MKKCMYLLLSLVIVLLTACSSDDKDEKAEKGDKLAVDKGLLNVEITIPASFFEGQDLDTVIADAKKDGVSEVTKNDDGSLTYKMSKSKHKELMKELKTNIQKTIDETKNGEDFPSIKDIKANKSYSEFTLEVDQSAFENSMDGFATLTLAMSGMFYQLFDGVDSDDYKVTITLKDQATQKVFNEIVYPDALNE
ncbi:MULTISPECIES: hypothetical protein, partial [Bacillus]|uniref:hypothetical protein n=1 Tax=Bacillus TaxID=1386 RepID=UPI000362C158